MVASNISGKRARRDPAEVLGSTLQVWTQKVRDTATRHYFRRWQQTTFFQKALDHTRRLVQQRTVCLDKLRTAYVRDVLSVKSYLQQQLQQQENGGGTLLTIPEEINRAPSADLRNYFRKHNEEAKAELCARKDAAFRRCVLGMSPRDKEFCPTADAEEAAVHDLSLEMYAPSSHSLVIKPCADCFGVATFIVKRNRRVDDALKLLDSEERLGEGMASLRATNAKLLDRALLAEARLEEAGQLLLDAKSAGEDGRDWLVKELARAVRCTADLEAGARRRQEDVAEAHRKMERERMKHKHAADMASEACRSRIAENEVALETLKEALAHSTAEARREAIRADELNKEVLSTREIVDRTEEKLQKCERSLDEKNRRADAAGRECFALREELHGAREAALEKEAKAGDRLYEMAMALESEETESRRLTLKLDDANANIVELREQVAATAAAAAASHTKAEKARRRYEHELAAARLAAKLAAAPKIEVKSRATQTLKAHSRLSLRLTARACALGVKRGRQEAWKVAAGVISAVRIRAAFSNVVPPLEMPLSSSNSSTSTPGSEWMRVATHDAEIELAVSRLKHGEENFALSLSRIQQAVDLLLGSLRQDDGGDSVPSPSAFPRPGSLLDPSLSAIVAFAMAGGPSEAPCLLDEMGKTGSGVSSHGGLLRDAAVGATVAGGVPEAGGAGEHSSVNNNGNNSADIVGPEKTASKDRGNPGASPVAGCSTRSDTLDTAEGARDDEDGDRGKARTLVATIFEARSRVLKLRVKLATAIKRATMGRETRDAERVRMADLVTSLKAEMEELQRRPITEEAALQTVLTENDMRENEAITLRLLEAKKEAERRLETAEEDARRDIEMAHLKAEEDALQTEERLHASHVRENNSHAYCRRLEARVVGLKTQRESLRKERIALRAAIQASFKDADAKEREREDRMRTASTQVRCCVCAIREELGGEFEDAEGGVLQGKASRWSPCLNVPQFYHGVSRIAESPPSDEAAVMDGGMSPGGGRREFTPPGPEGNDGKYRGRRQGGGGRRQRLRNVEQGGAHVAELAIPQSSSGYLGQRGIESWSLTTRAAPEVEGNLVVSVAVAAAKLQRKRLWNVREEVATFRTFRAAKPRPRDQRAIGGTWKQCNAPQNNNVSGNENNKRSNSNNGTHDKRRPASAGQGERQSPAVPTRRSVRGSDSGLGQERFRLRGNHSSSSSSALGPLGSVSNNCEDDEDGEFDTKSLYVPRAVSVGELTHRQV